MFFKALYGVSMGVMAFTMLFMAPNGRVLVKSASPDKVQKAAPTGSSKGTRSRSRGPRYVWISHHGK